MFDILKNKLVISILSGFFVFMLTIASCITGTILPYAIFLGISFAVIVYKFNNLCALRIKKEIEIENEIRQEKEKVLKGYNSYINQLSNIIAGINHEVAPWLGGIQNKIQRLQDKANKLNKPSSRKNLSDEFSMMNPAYVLQKLDEIKIAADTAIQILKNRSRDIKKLQKYSTNKSNLFDTINTWIGIAVVDRSIKGNISEENLYLHFDSLNFDVNHSPLLLSQIILNLVKNSVEHNPHMLETLLITISGDQARNCLIYEDNGKGIDTEKIGHIFEPGITTKNFEKEIHGLGLSLCVDYCECMGSAIVAEKSNTGAKFVIYFDYDYANNPQHIKNVDIKKEI
jgi:signal transduction histidine kinase